MIRFPQNGHAFEYMVSSGGLAFDGLGWPWERPLVWCGLIKPELFTVVLKTLTREPEIGNLRWATPWTSVRLLPGGGAANKIALTNRGIEWWCESIGPKLDYKKYSLVGSIYGTVRNLVEMAMMLNRFDLVGIEVNGSCPNILHPIAQAQTVIDSVKAVAHVSRHPVIAKVSVDQPYLDIARGLAGTASAIALNSVRWEIVFPNERSPLWRLERRVGGGGGGVSGKPAQVHNWAAVQALAEDGSLPVIGPSVMEFEDIERVRTLGADAVSFGAIHLRTPWRPTSYVEREKKHK